jgi:hypothetical protein
MRYRLRRFLPFASVAATLSLCAVAARLPAKTLSVALGNSDGPPPSSAWQTCDNPRERVWAEAWGFNQQLQLVCDAYDSTGSTATESCPDTAVVQQPRLYSQAFDCLPLSGLGSCTPIGPERLHCAPTIAPWEWQRSCSRTLVASQRVASPPHHGTECHPITFTAGAWGN